MKVDSNNRAKLMFQLAEIYGWKCYYCGDDVLDLAQFHYECRVYESSLRDYYDGYSKVKPEEPVCQIGAPSLDHKIPHAHGGSNKIDNLVLACCMCNMYKGARFTADEFVELKKLYPGNNYTFARRK